MGDSGARRVGVMDAVRAYAPLWPAIMGLAFARSSIIVGSYTSYTSTDAGLLTDGATFLSLGTLLVLMLILFRTKHRLSKRAVRGIQLLCVALQAACLVLLQWGEALGLAGNLPLFILSALNSLLGLMMVAYWLRRLRGSSTETAAVTIFSAMIVSELVISIEAGVPDSLEKALGALITLLQLPLMAAARSAPQAYTLVTPTQESDYIGFMGNNIANARFLAVTGMGIAFMSFVIGFLRGFPIGAPIALAPISRALYVALTIAICLYVMQSVLIGRKRVTTLDIWIIMQALATFSLVFHALFPDELSYAAALTTTLNATMVVFVWYAIVAFMSHGWRDPYYYAIGGLAVFLVPRAMARVGLLLFDSLMPSELLLVTLMAGCIVVSTQFILIQLLRVQIDSKKLERREARATEGIAAEEPPRKSSILERVMGIDVGEESLAVLREETMRRNIQQLGRQFMLSDREVEVLSLYALGYTQQRVADELYISPGTVHAHIKRIYAKTELHSRQAILDYIKQYAD